MLQWKAVYDRALAQTTYRMDYPDGAYAQIAQGKSGRFHWSYCKPGQWEKNDIEDVRKDAEQAVREARAAQAPEQFGMEL